MTTAESARIAIMMTRTAVITAVRPGGSTVEIIGTEIIMAEMRTADVAPFRGIRNSATPGKVVFLTLIVVISMQTKQKSFSTRKHMVPTRSTKMSTRIALKRLGEGSLTIKGADSKVAAEAAGEEEATLGGVDFRAAGEEAEGGTRTKGIAHKEISRATITKIKATTMIIIIIRGKEGATTQGLPGIKILGVTNKPPKMVIRSLRGIISISPDVYDSILMRKALPAIWEPARAMVVLGAGEPTSLRALLTYGNSTAVLHVAWLM